MKNLHVLTALLEVVTGIALLVSPAATVALVVGAALDTPGGLEWRASRRRYWRWASPVGWRATMDTALPREDWLRPCCSITGRR